MKKVCIVIVTYNSMKWISKCLTSIYLSSYPTTVIVVDNNSSDNSCSFIKKQYPEVILLEMNENLGFGKANNIGIRYALECDADYFFLLNQDVYIETDTIYNLIREIESGDYAIISPIQMNGDGSCLDTHFRDAVIAKCVDYLDATQNGKKQTIFETSFIAAASWFMSRKTISEIGGFNPLFQHYGEDDNYVSRVSFHNKRIAFTTKAKIFHDRGRVGNVSAYNKNAYYRELLILATDIALSDRQMECLLREKFINYCLFSFLALIALKWKLLHNKFPAYYKIFVNIRTIKKYRKEERKKQLNWI